MVVCQVTFPILLRNSWKARLTGVILIAISESVLICKLAQQYEKVWGVNLLWSEEGNSYKDI